MYNNNNNNYTTNLYVYYRLTLLVLLTLIYSYTYTDRVLETLAKYSFMKKPIANFALEPTFRICPIVNDYTQVERS